MTDFYSASQLEQVAALTGMARNALAKYPGEFGTPELVKYRENAIFGVSDRDGNRFALRIHRPDYHSDAALESELWWMDALAEEGLPVPRVMANADGKFITPATAKGVPESRCVDLLSWLGGLPLSHLEESGELSLQARIGHYTSLGRLMARLHNHSASWPRPDGFSRHDWFGDALVGPDPIWGRFWELDALSDEQREIMLWARTEGARMLASYPRHEGNSGLIHADLIADNLMVEGDKLRPIDFDDAGFGWHMFDIATSLYFVSREPDYPALRDALLAGYREKRELPRSEEEALPLFLMLRSTTYLGWVSTRSETETARELSPILIEQACATCDSYRLQCV
ncbi:phosphotransferase enzyme family protein [Aurantiacibacter gilvus]|uniref:Phosphotransferase n=1 Tax=Aurantiacibacter gilvus TaxID=3139141 RepID=A0ABU9IGC3_9SPHN